MKKLCAIKIWDCKLFLTTGLVLYNFSDRYSLCTNRGNNSNAFFIVIMYVECIYDAIIRSVTLRISAMFGRRNNNND